jgi:flagellar motor component MotA
MKITKRQLRRIIKEEKTQLLTETLQSVTETLTNAIAEYVMSLDEEWGYDIPNDQLKAEVMNLVDGHFDMLQDMEDNPEMYR